MNLNLDFVPSTLSEAIEILITSLDVDEKRLLSTTKESNMCGYHHTYGLLLRNSWSLWEQNTPLCNYFKTIGITHPDDITSIILLSTNRTLRNTEIKLNNQVKNIQRFWKTRLGRPIP